MQHDDHDATAAPWGSIARQSDTTWPGRSGRSGVPVHNRARARTNRAGKEPASRPTALAFADKPPSWSLMARLARHLADSPQTFARLLHVLGLPPSYSTLPTSLARLPVKKLNKVCSLAPSRCLHFAAEKPRSTRGREVGPKKVGTIQTLCTDMEIQTFCVDTQHASLSTTVRGEATTACKWPAALALRNCRARSVAHDSQRKSNQDGVHDNNESEAK